MTGSKRQGNLRPPDVRPTKAYNLRRPLVVSVLKAKRGRPVFAVMKVCPVEKPRDRDPAAAELLPAMDAPERDLGMTRASEHFKEKDFNLEEIVMSQSRRCEGRERVGRMGLLVIAAVLIVVFAGGSARAKPLHQKNYASPEEAVKAMVDAVKADNMRLLLRIFGPGSKAIILSGDPVQDKQGREWFVKHYEEKNRLEEASGTVTLHVGNDDWPFPIPIVKTERGWKFDTKAGRQEILARRVGRNELNAIQVCLAYVDVQKEYALRKAREGKGLPEYAQEFVSTPGKQDGLYWEAGEGGEQSPMGPLFAAAHESGYGGEPLGGTPTPYHGYLYRILKAPGHLR